MNYLTLTFASFVLILFIVFYLVPKKVRGFVLLFGSLFFYGCFDLRYLIFLLVVAISTFIAAKFINKSERPKMILCVCIILNVIMWFVIKVLPWTCHTIVRFISLFDANVTEPTLNLLVPIGISYYMLQAISYIADVYTKKLAPEKHFGKYLLFLSYFPAIVQGPISRFSQLMPQLLHQKNFSFDQMRTGLLLILFGLVKKMVLADRIGIFVDYCFENYTDLGGARSTLVLFFIPFSFMQIFLVALISVAVSAICLE